MGIRLSGIGGWGEEDEEEEEEEGVGVMDSKGNAIIHKRTYELVLKRRRLSIKNRDNAFSRLLMDGPNMVLASGEPYVPKCNSRSEWGNRCHIRWRFILLDQSPTCHGDVRKCIGAEGCESQLGDTTL